MVFSGAQIFKSFARRLTFANTQTNISVTRVVVNATARCVCVCCSFVFVHREVNISPFGEFGVQKFAHHNGCATTI